MRTIEIGKPLLQYNQEFFEIYDFVFLMFLVTSSMFALVSLLRISPAGDLIQTNLTFYVMLLQLALWLTNLCKNSFNLGWFRYTDETKLQMFMAVKAFIVVQAAFQYGLQVLDFDIRKCHYRLNERINQAFLPFGVKPRDIPIDFTISIFAMLAAIISFSVAKIQIRFGYFFYVRSSVQ
jgi:hypothetical protein